MSRSDDEVLQFVAASLPSVWAVEVLLALKSERRVWSAAELVAALRASELVVSKAIEALAAAGLVSVEDSGAIYMPVNRDAEDIVEAVEKLYRARPNALRRAIVSASSHGATAFANAFKFRRGRGD